MFSNLLSLRALYQKLQNRQLLLNGFYCDSQIMADQPASSNTKRKRDCLGVWQFFEIDL